VVSELKLTGKRRSNIVLERTLLQKGLTMGDLMLDVDQAGELKAAFRRGNWTNAEIKRLCEGDILAQVRDIIRGRLELKAIEHVIDCDADPYLPEGWKVEEHQKSGLLKWDAKLVELWFAKGQQNGKVLKGDKLRQELVGKPVLNACVLDYLLANPHLIPEEWKGKCVFFWGTIYRSSGGNLYVRYLYWSGGGWDWRFGWLAYDWHDNNPSALRTSN